MSELKVGDAFYGEVKIVGLELVHFDGDCNVNVIATFDMDYVKKRSEKMILAAAQAINSYDANQELIEQLKSDSETHESRAAYFSNVAYKYAETVSKQAADIELLREALKSISEGCDTVVSAASIADCALAATNPDKE